MPWEEMGFDMKNTDAAAVVHFAAIPRILQASDIETYKVNVMGTYNVIEAAIKLGIKKIICFI